MKGQMDQGARSQFQMAKIPCRKDTELLVRSCFGWDTKLPINRHKETW